MKDLAGFQKNFSLHLLGNEELPAGLADSTEAQRRGLSVYRNNVFFSLTSALGDLYPVVRMLVGERFFRQLARRYLLAHPPKSAAMVNLGGDFPNYIASGELPADLAYIADIARLEIARHESFHAPDAAALQPELLQNLGVGQLMSSTLQLHPSLRIVESEWAIHSIWSAHQTENADFQKIPIRMPESVLVVRPDIRPRLFIVKPGFVEMLRQLEQGHNLSVAIEAALDQYADFDAGSAVAFCINQGIFIQLLNHQRGTENAGHT